MGLELLQLHRSSLAKPAHLVAQISIAAKRVFKAEEASTEFWSLGRNHKAMVLYNTALVRGFTYGIKDRRLLSQGLDRKQIEQLAIEAKRDPSTPAGKLVLDSGAVQEDLRHCQDLENLGYDGIRIHGFRRIHHKWSTKSKPDGGLHGFSPSLPTLKGTNQHSKFHSQLFFQTSTRERSQRTRMRR